MNDLLKNLNPAQQEAVKATEGPVLIIAGEDREKPEHSLTEWLI